MALSLTSLLVIAAMVLDFGIVRVDRQVDKSGADAAVMAGLQGMAAGGGSMSSPYAGICNAMNYLQQNDPRFAAMSSSGAGASWSTLATPPAAVTVNCNLPPSTSCTPGDTSTWVKYVWSGSYQGTALQVSIQNGYSLPDPSFPEDSLPAASSDNSDGAQGCDQLAVIIKQNRKPGLGSLATSSDLVSTIRSVGRVTPGNGDTAPALLLLKRTGCPSLSIGAAAGGSHIYVLGAESSNGITQPGTIHADADGSSCSGSIFAGKGSSGIAAFAAPLASNPAQADPAKPGLLTALAAVKGFSGTSLRDSNDYVCGSTQIATATSIPVSPCSIPRQDVAGRGLVTRGPIDDRYLAAVDSIGDAAKTVFTTVTAASHPNYTLLPGGCSPTATQVANAGLTSTSKVFVDCTANNGFTAGVTIPGSVFVFNGSVQPSGTLSLPNATKVYIAGAAAKDGISLTNGNTFSVHSQGNTSGSLCSNSPTGLGNDKDKAVVVVKSGDLKETGGTLQMCYTTLVMMGNDSTTAHGACLPSSSGTAPTSTPCNGGAGDSQLSQTGGNVDWTAPNVIDVTIDSSGTPTSDAEKYWADTDGPEDLAFWDESYGGSSNPNYQMAGGGTFHTVGVYMVPNADPFTITGSATQTLTNAQYIATSIQLSGNNATLIMTVDPNSAVPLPRLALVGLVR